jgi:hypothetical protein
MKLNSPRSSSTYLALATATVWVHCRIDPDHPIPDADRIAAFELAIDRTKLSRESATTLARKGERTRIPLKADNIVELRCTVQYGPVYRCCEQDFEKSMYTIEAALLKVQHFNHVMSDAWDYERRSLTLAGLKAQIDVITARTKDDNPTAAAREGAERRLARNRSSSHSRMTTISHGQPSSPRRRSASVSARATDAATR